MKKNFAKFGKVKKSLLKVKAKMYCNINVTRSTKSEQKAESLTINMHVCKKKFLSEKTQIPDF